MKPTLTIWLDSIQTWPLGHVELELQAVIEQGMATWVCGPGVPIDLHSCPAAQSESSVQCWLEVEDAEFEEDAQLSAPKPTTSAPITTSSRLELTPFSHANLD